MRRFEDQSRVLKDEVNMIKNLRNKDKDLFARVQQEIMNNYTKAMKYIQKLDTMRKRVEFAGHRVQAIQGLLKRKNVFQDKRIKDLETRLVHEENTNKQILSQHVPRRAQEELMLQLEKEIMVLKHERDYLLHKAHEDAAQVDTRVTEIVGNYKNEMTETRNQVQRMQNELLVTRQALQEKTKVQFECIDYCFNNIVYIT